MVFADVLCLRRRRRGDWRLQPVQQEQRRQRKHSVLAQPANRGCAKMPLPVTEDTPPDMLAGAMDIKVVLPSGRTVSMSVERSTPMMDLLVQLTTVHKLSLAGHTTVALSDSGYPLHHLPSTPLGALDTRLIHVAQRTNTLKRAPLRPNNVQPFTTTFRLQVHLPRNQLFVTRVSPDTRLADILHLACSEKNLDPDKYELRHPANLCECLSLSHTLADYRLQEVTLVASRPPGAPLTPADIMSLQREEEKRRQQVKKTGGIYSIIFNKRSKGIPDGSGSVSSDSLNGRSISPARSDESVERSVSPPAPAPPQRPGRKRRPAPKPPAPFEPARVAPPAVTDLQHNARETGVDSNKEGSTTLSHSRTSSDSSGYHEASVLSESPDTRANSCADTLPRRSKLPSTNHIVAKNKSSTLQHGTGNVGSHSLSRSLSNLTAVGINSQNMHSASTSSLASQGLMPRKKKAAPPPPAVLGKQLNTQQTLPDSEGKREASKPTEVVAALIRDIKTFDENATTIPNVDERLPNSDRHVSKLDDIPDEEDVVLDLTTTKRTSAVQVEVEIVGQTTLESQRTVTESRSPSLDVATPRVERSNTPVVSPDLVTSAIVHSPPPAVQELTQSRPKPKPRVLEPPQPQPRQVPRLRRQDAPLPSASPQHYQTFEVEQTMFVPPDEASTQSVPSQKTDSNHESLTENKSHGPTDSFELDVKDELKMFEMPMSAIIEPEETNNFSDLDFETSLSSMDKMSLEDYETEHVPKSSASQMLPDKTGMNNEQEEIKYADNMGSVTSLRSIEEMRKDSIGSATSLNSLDKSNERPVGSVTSLRSIGEMRKDSIGSATSSNSLDKPNKRPVGSVTSLKSLEETKKDILGSATSLNSLDKVSEGPVSSATNLDGLVRPKSPLILGDQDEKRDEVIPPSIESEPVDSGRPTSTPDIEELPEWQYHLPAPPSAFRDLHSPTTTEFETVVLADANVFRESPPDERNKFEPVRRSRDETGESDGVSNDRSTPAGHGSPSSLRSTDSDERPEAARETVAPIANAAHSETDWEPQTISVAEQISRTKPRFNNGDLRLRQDGVTKEVYKVNPIFNGRRYEDDVANGDAKAKPETNATGYKNKTSSSTGRPASADLQLSNQLKNFTISTYNKPQNVDSIFSEKEPDRTDSTFKRPFTPAGVPPVARTNSYSTVDKDRPAPSVKRSTSYVSLARPYAKPSTFQSIARTKSISSLVREEDSGSSGLRKSTSDANLNQVEDVPLQSLQVLKAILPRLSQSQTLYNQSQALYNQSLDSSQSQALNNQSQDSNKSQTLYNQSQDSIQSQMLYNQSQDSSKLQALYNQSQALYNQSQDSSQSQAPKQSVFQDTYVNAETNVQTPLAAANIEEATPEHNPQETKSEPRPFVYLGPPAINFSTWSERPKVQVSLKSDRDYRMGKQSSAPNLNAQRTSKETERTGKSIVGNETAEVLNRPEERSSKIEPTPLTMRIVSHTPSSYRSNASLLNIADQRRLDNERLPIVRAVELKKTQPESSVQLRNMSTTHLNGSSTNNVANVPVNYHQGTMYNRHSYIEPGFGKVAASVNTNVNPVLKKSVSTSQISIEAPSKNTANGGKKYTSVIGINGAGAGSAKVIQHAASVQNMQPSVQLPRSQSGRQNFSTVKVNGFGVQKPMPIVKGFRLAGTDAANQDRGPVKISIETDKTERFPAARHGFKTNGAHHDPRAAKQPLKTVNGIENLKGNSSASLSFGGKVDRVDGRDGNNIPEPPKPPPMVTRKTSQRPVPRFTNPRDELMDAIKNFGGRESLKPSKPQPNTNVVLTI